MYLKRLELVGFKSFAQKTVLDFPGGITVVVGPNGSGKSNIIDAIRWLLGEREAKNIRGAKAEDLIFAGTPQRPRMGMAQVTMIFDNQDHFFPVDYVEVSVRRQVIRDGTSRYFLNDAEVRLKDVIDFFAKARLGTKGFAIVNQGDSDIFVKASSGERRVMIEEILGLRQYQLKKHEAERKLETTKFNLEKSEAMVEELMPHLRLLRRQTTKWEKQAEVAKELEDLEKRYFGLKLSEITKDFKEIDIKIAAWTEKIAEKSKELRNLQNDLEKVEKSAPKGDRSFEDFKKKQEEILFKKSGLQKELGRLEAQMEFLISQPKTGLTGGIAVKILEEVKDGLKAAMLKSDIKELHDFIRRLIEKIERLFDAGGQDKENRLTELEGMKKKIAADLVGIDESLNELSKLEIHLTADLKNFNEVFKRAFEAAEKKKDEITKLDNEKNQLLFERERIEIRKQELANLASQANKRLDDFTEAMSEGSVDFGELERKMFKLRAELAGIGELDPSLIKEAQETEGRYNFLSHQIEDLKKAWKDLETLIRDLDEKIHTEFIKSLSEINDRFNHYFRLMFGGGRAHLRLEKPEVKESGLVSEEVKEEASEDPDVLHKIDHGGIEIDLNIPKKKISGLDMLSGGEKSLVSIAMLFAVISVSPPPFLVLDEVDAALDERNTKRFADLISESSKKTQFLLVSHNRATMEAADILYGVTMKEDGVSKVFSLKLDEVVAA